MGVALLLLLLCSPVYAHETRVQPPWVQNRADIEQMETKVDTLASKRWVISLTHKLEKVNDTQAETVAYIKIIVYALSGVVGCLTSVLTLVIFMWTRQSRKKTRR